MPPKTGLAFILIQHLSPDYKSLMAELLSKRLAAAAQEPDFEGNYPRLVEVVEDFCRTVMPFHFIVGYQSYRVVISG